MTNYAAVVFAACCISGALGLLVYKEGRGESLSLGIITLFLLVSPIADLSGSVGGGLSDLLDTPSVEIGSGYADALEQSYAEGLCLALGEKFTIEKEDIAVRIVGFDAESLRAERIELILSGDAALCDYRAVEKYIEEISSGECRVEIEIGK